MTEEEELEERIEKLEETVDEQRKEIRRLRNRRKQEEGAQRTENEDSQEVSRRDFLKKLGVGAAGLGLLSLSPAAAKTTISPNGIDVNGRNLFTSSGGNGLVINDVVTSTDNLPSNAPEGAQIVVNPPESQPELYIFDK